MGRGRRRRRRGGGAKTIEMEKITDHQFLNIMY
jgi:hypothetical protein